MENGQNKGNDGQHELTEREILKAQRVKITGDTAFSQRFRYQSILMLAILAALTVGIALFPNGIAVQMDWKALVPGGYISIYLYTAIILGVGVYEYVKCFSLDKTEYLKHTIGLALLLALHAVICIWNFL
jgi:hypothetical protein